MKRVKKFLRRRGRLAAGVHFAMMMAASGKAVTHANGAKSPALPLAILHKKKAIPSVAELTGRTAQDAKEVALIADNIWDMAAKISEAKQPGNQSQIDPTLTTDQARLWLQSYNAGPYAVLKYKGHVPYRETQNYSPRVFKYYKEDLTNSPYEPYIQQSAAKYGLDPQMIRAIMKTESDFDNATTSHAGARGLMQVMPVVWKDIKARYNLTWDYSSGVFEPEKNIEVACAYLAWLRYDFLPRHFAEFEQNPTIPANLVRDKAPPRQTPRILASAISPAEAVAAVATASPAAATKVIASAASAAVKSAVTHAEKKVPMASADSAGLKVSVSSKVAKPAAKPGKQHAKTALGTAPVTVPASKITSVPARTVAIHRAAINPAQVKVASAPVRNLKTGAKRPEVSGSAGTVASRTKAIQQKAPIAVPSSKITKAPSVADAGSPKPKGLKLTHQRRG